MPKYMLANLSREFSRHDFLPGQSYDLAKQDVQKWQKSRVWKLIWDTSATPMCLKLCILASTLIVILFLFFSYLCSCGLYNYVFYHKIPLKTAGDDTRYLFTCCLYC